MIEEIKRCIAVLSGGGTIIYPTDTVWGLGCDATQGKAVDKVFEIKGRQKTKSLILLLDSMDKLERYVDEVPAIAWDLLEQVDTPLTIIYPGARNLAPNVIAPDGSIAIRIVREDFCRQLIARFNKPLVSTSANFSGDPSPVSFKKIHPEFLKKADYVVNWNREVIRTMKPSAIMKIALNGEIELIRP
ncbi:MAG TPA: L-threonylcarbamoyladenylate synthase [Bacteroidales bacterium]|nr:L-threonylcarbamoyladenylate synthase [Bacteroidales bacterium]HSA43861.1 L-threonylcarbamoyladenylate synthase [Bacteroidales bacterium]